MTNTVHVKFIHEGGKCYALYTRSWLQSVDWLIVRMDGSIGVVIDREQASVIVNRKRVVEEIAHQDWSIIGKVEVVWEILYD